MTRLILLAALAAGAAMADVVYIVNVDTSSIAGTTGAIEFQFNPGFNSLPATAQVQQFQSDGTLGTAFPSIGNVTGTLPTTLTFVNDPTLNDYFQEFTFGNSLTFQVVLGGDGINAPDGISSGSGFAYALWADTAASAPALATSDPFGSAGQIVFDSNGSVAAQSFIGEASITPAPEPGTTVLFAAGGLFLLVARRRRRSAS